MKKLLRCENCGEERQHHDVRSDISRGSRATAVFACDTCKQEQGPIAVSKDELMGRPPPSEVRFHCEDCQTTSDHRVTTIWRGHVRATIVLHCTECNREARRQAPVDEIPQVFLDLEPKPKAAGEEVVSTA